MHNYINEANCVELCGMNFAKLISLSGIFGIHPELKPSISQLGNKDGYKELQYIRLFKCEKILSYVLIEFETIYLEELTVRIHLFDRVIENQKIKSSKVKSGISLPRLGSQVYAARQAGFRTIFCDAFGGNGFEGYDGYIIWAKYGYQMAPQDYEDFLLLMAQNGRNERSLHDLIMSPSGLDLWQKKGKSWFALFDTNSGSPSSIILEQCLTIGGHFIEMIT